MADAAPSISASPLAALLTATTADLSAGSATTQSADPFAALLAIAVAPKATIGTATAQSADPVASLLATAAVPTTNVAVVTAPAADPIATLLATANTNLPETNAAAATAPAVDPIAALPAPQPAVPAALPVTKAAARAPAPVPTPVSVPVPVPIPGAASAIAPPVETKAAPAVIKDDAADHDKPAAKDEDKDPLAVAIASGATAVLALAPAIVTPVPAQVPTPAPTPIPTATPLTAASARKVGNVATGVNDAPRFKTPIQAASSDRATTALPADAARTPTRDREGSGSPQTAPAPVAETSSTTAPLSPEALRAVMATLQQSDETSTQPIPAAIAPPAAPPTFAAKVEGEQPQQPVVQTAQQPAAPAQMQPRRRSDELAAPRRANDTRRRAETASADLQPVGLAQRASETARAPAAEIPAPVAVKGDLLVQQTLTIAKDGAWLDRLAHDIASSAGNGGNLHFKLEPQNLGALSVAISQSPDGASIRMTADNDTTRNILLDAQPKLVAEARAHGLKVSDTQVDLNQNHSQNQGANQDASRAPHSNSGQNSMAQNGQNRQSSPDHQPFVSNLVRKAEAESESPERDTDALYA